ncbi:hypothetical protein Pla123a_48150 [Posidoniimonas polymericola]|uniref:Transposase IS30-like HTH domain-containing protein n=1 Tax=Posidoniimonas polymericola TaxID=2528002 RepID=A0A5C5XSK8_9BACT|nr:hypothetical protein [Posidoniimonas polymericola]TWT65904.1 hypothetical protein Pla123a_48150 [Posidoniimonas polymericola]
MARPRVLDEGKQREVCALLTAGMTMGEAAAYVGCCEKTIGREQTRDEGFDERVRRARMAARLGPLQAVRQAAATHWRAAAWLVDRQDRQEDRERRARREQVKRKQQLAKSKPKQPAERWNLEQEIQQIASARPAAGERCSINKSPRRQPREQPSTAALPPTTRTKRPSPVAAALREMAGQLAASANRESAQRTKSAPQRVSETSAEPAAVGGNTNDGDPAGEGFVPSLRILGQNEEGAAMEAGELAGTVPSAEPPAAAGGCSSSLAMSDRADKPCLRFTPTPALPRRGSE